MNVYCSASLPSRPLSPSKNEDTFVQRTQRRVLVNPLEHIDSVVP